jgi:hypothetical protein
MYTRTSFPLQQWLRERYSMLCLHVGFLSCIYLRAHQLQPKFNIQIFWIFDRISLTNTEQNVTIFSVSHLKDFN